MKQSSVEERKILLDAELKKIVEVLKQEYDPEKIILFGSLLDGNIHEYSDIDLLIIKKTSKRPIDRILEVAQIINPLLGVDLFVYTPEEFDTLVNEKYTFFTNILKNSKVLYEKRNSRVD
ncbi:MAG TPA: nucleotidyltransferase domain-containing protein [Spirochaetota bacterium]|nr:nucleotidyltransferase domain-containing protein [Spirochaetota bacterium]